MKPSPFLALLALLPLGCAGATPGATEPSSATNQHPTAVTVVDLTPATPAEPPVDPHAAHKEALAEAADLGVLGVLKGDQGDVLSDGEALTPGQLEGLMAPINDPFGSGGVVGGVAGGVGFGGIGIGGGGGGGGGLGVGIGIGSGRTAPKVGQSQVVAGPTASSSGIPKEIIQRIVRRNMSQLRFCYEKGLNTNPKLQGTVSVHFTILKDGSVARVYLGKDTTLTEINVTQCVMTAFGSFAFPPPDGGAVVNVGYPLVFTPPPPSPPPSPPPAAPVPAKKP